MLGFLKAAAPDWTSASEWLNAALPRAAERGETWTTHRDREIQLQVVKSLGMATLTMKAKNSGA